MKRTLIGIIAILSSALVFSACGNIDDESSAEPKVTSADSSSLSDSSETTSAKSVTTTTVSSADDSSSAVTTTSIVTGTDKNGKVTTLIIGEGGKILSTFKNSNTTSKTTTKATAKTTTTKQSNSVNNNQNNGGNYNNNGGNNGGNYYQPENNGGNYNNGGNNNTPVVNDPPQTQAQTQKKTTTTTQPPQTKPAPVQTEKQFKDMTPVEMVEKFSGDDLTKAYLKFALGKENATLTEYDWELIRQDFIEYGMENYNGKKDFYYDTFGGYTISYPYPIKLVPNYSLAGYDCAHLDVGSGAYCYTELTFMFKNVTTESDLYNIAESVRNDIMPFWDTAIESVHYIRTSSGALDSDNTKLVEAACEIEFNIGPADDGYLWFLT